MASVLFSTVGKALGGPLGAGIGVAVGASIDGNLFRRTRRGAQDGFATRSAYGEVVPLVFGRTRVAGQLIWAMQPAAAGTKGEGQRARSTSFAVALSRGPIVEIGRIWADGSLLRNAEGVFLTDSVFRIHSVGEAEPDPLIAAAEGPSVPSYAHLSYVVFENFDLGPYGNRIPSLSFEVVAGEGSARDWVGELTRTANLVVDASAADASIDGYVARLDPFAEDFTALVDAAGCKVGIRDGMLAVLAASRTATISTADLSGAQGKGDGEAVVRHDARPSGLGLAFQDNDRDYQLGWQQEVRNRRGAALTVSWSAAATASMARSLAVRLLQEAEAGSDTISFAVSHRHLGTTVGDAVDFGDGVSWLIVRREVRGLWILMEGRRLPNQQSRMAMQTDAGRILPPRSEPVPPTTVKIIEPPVPISPQQNPVLLVSASGLSGWEGAHVQLLQGGEELPVGTARESLAFGVLTTSLAPGPSTIWDENSSLLVEVDDQDALFLSRNQRDVLDGGGLVAVGEELLQYRHADLVAQGLVRLSGLLRGSYGTLAAGAPAGEIAIAVPRAGGVHLDVDVDMLDRNLIFLVGGRGDMAGGRPITHIVQGAGRAPLAPVHLRGVRSPDGAVDCSWIERSRAMWRWDDGKAAPVSQVYAWHFRAGNGSRFTLNMASNSLRLDTAQQLAAFGGPLPSGEFQVEALGDGPEALRHSRWMAI